MDQSPQVSIIMPCHNGERTLLQAVNSAIHQTFPDWELLIVNDGSTDGSRSLLHQFTLSDSRIRVLHNPQPGGVAAARNRALTEARARYVAFLDCDDAWLPHKLELQLEALKEHGAALICGAYEVMDEHGQLIGKVNPKPGILTYRRLLGNNPIGCLTVMLDRSQCGEVHFTQELAKSEDYYLWLTLLKQGLTGICLGETLAIYRVQAKSLSSNKVSAARYRWRVYRKFEKLNLLQSLYHFGAYTVSGVLKNLSMRRYRYSRPKDAATLGDVRPDS